MKIIFSLLLLVMFSVGCNGQVKTFLPKVNTGMPRTIAESNARIKRTQGSNWGANVCCALQDKSGNLWFGTTGEGIYRYDGKSFINFTEKDGLSSNNISCIYEDKNGKIWFATGNGICIYNPLTSDSKMFSTLQLTHNVQGARTIVLSILQDKTGNYWFGTNQGVYRYNGKSFSKFLQNDHVINKYNLNLEFITAMLEDKNGIIWFASYSQEGVCRFDGKSITNFKPNNDGMICSMLEDKKGNLWFGTKNHGVSRYDGKTFNAFADIDIFSTAAVFAIAEDKSGNIWFGTESGRNGEGSGAWCYNPSASVPGSNAFTNLRMKDGDGYNSVFCVLTDKSGRLWFGTRNIGLFSYDGKILTDFSDKQ